MEKKDIAAFQISCAKKWADGKKYFSIFEKHIPSLGAGKHVLIYDISNLDAISKILEKITGSDVWIYGDKHVNAALHALGYNFTDVQIDGKYNIPDMKFDCIIMNPPYSKNLHLKILAEAIKHLKDDDSLCVNLSPDNWLTNPYKMFEHESTKRNSLSLIGTHISEHISISATKFNDTFSTSNWFGVGLFCIKKNTTDFDVHRYDSKNPLMIKLIKQISSLDSLRSHFSRRIASNFLVPVRRTNHGYLNWCEFDDNIVKSKDGIQFKTQLEVDNFKHSVIDTFFYRFLAKCDWDGGQNSAAVPWMGDSINPRTGKKGYESEWTDKDFYNFFNIVEEEQKIIEDTMKKYEAK